MNKRLIRSIYEDWQISASQSVIFEIDDSQVDEIRSIVKHFNYDDPTLEIRNKIWGIVVPELPVQILDITIESDFFLLRFTIKSDDIRFISDKNFCFIFKSQYKKQKTFFLVDACVVGGHYPDLSSQTYTIRYFEHQIWSKLC